MQSMRLPFAGLLLGLCIPSFASAQTIISGDAGTLTLSDNVLTGNGAAAYHLGPNIYPSGGTLAGNGFNGIDLVGGTTTVSGTYAHNLLINQFAPVSVGVGQTLTLNPGIDVRLRREGTYIEVYGTLKAEGTPANHIRFTTHIPGQNWQTVVFRSGSSGSLRHCDLEFGGLGMINVQDATDVSVDHSTLRLAQGDALQGYIGNGGPSSLTVTSCTIADNAQNGFNLTRGPSGTVTLGDNAFTSNGGSAYRLGPDIYPTGGSTAGNGFNGIDLVGGSVSVSGTYAHDLLFNAFAPLMVPAGRTLTIAPGVEVRFMQGGTYLDVSGSLRAESVPGDFIRFMPHVPGHPWQAVILRAGSSARFRYCDFTDGGSDM